MKTGSGPGRVHTSLDLSTAQRPPCRIPSSPCQDNRIVGRDMNLGTDSGHQPIIPNLARVDPDSRGVLIGSRTGVFFGIDARCQSLYVQDIRAHRNMPIGSSSSSAVRGRSYEVMEQKYTSNQPSSRPAKFSNLRCAGPRT